LTLLNNIFVNLALYITNITLLYMKIIPRFLIIICLLFPLSGSLLQHSSAQGWQWGRWNTGSGSDSWPVATDNSGNVFAGGFIWGTTVPSTFGTVTFPANIETSSYVVKYNAAGTPLWVKGNQTGDAYIINLATDAAGNVIMFGTFDSHTVTFDALTLTNTTSSYQYFVVKFDPLGNVLWGRNDGDVDFTVSYAFLRPCGIFWMLGTGSVATDATGNIYITSIFNSPTISIGGTTLTNTDPSGGSDDIFVAKYTSSGSVVWAKSNGGSADDEVYGIGVTPAGDIYVTGSYISPSITFGPSAITNPSGVANIFIARYNSSGSPTWAIGAGGTSCAFGDGVVCDAANNVYITGGFSANTLTFGAVTISRPYPATSYLNAYLIQLSPANVVTWSKCIGSPTSDVYGFCIALASCGEVWISGTFTDSANIDGTILHAPANSTDPIFLAGYNLSGGVVGSGALQSGSDDQNAMACDATGNVYICSDVQGFGISPSTPIIFGPDTLTVNPVTSGTEFFFLAKYQNVVTPPDTIFHNTDTTICAGDSVLLNGPTGYTFHHWSTGSFDSGIEIFAPGAYYVFCIGTCSTPYVIDTYHVSFASIDTQYTHGSDTLCANGNVSLYAPTGAYTHYLWDNNTTDSMRIVNAFGTYWVLCTGPCSLPYIFDTFRVVANPINLAFTLGNDTLSCEPVTLKIPENGLGYLWQDGSTKQTFIANNSGTYTATVDDYGCYASDTINVTIIDVRQQLNDTTVCVDSPFHVALYANVPQGSTVQWSNGSTDNSIIASTPGFYWVKVTDSVCTGYDSMQVLSEYCNCWCSVPSGFTPNDDGLNDFFKPIIDPHCMAGGYIFSVYNRWGQCVYSTTDRKGSWDGKFNGVPVDFGVYMYVVSFYGGINSNHFYFKGDVTLVR